MKTDNLVAWRGARYSARMRLRVGKPFVGDVEVRRNDLLTGVEDGGPWEIPVRLPGLPWWKYPWIRDTPLSASEKAREAIAALEAVAELEPEETKEPAP